MCGIMGYIGSKDTKKVLLDGLCDLEYRGYDSAGIAILQDNDIQISKAVGKLENLIEKSKDIQTKGFAIGIGHTRWATHGKASEENAHPHLSSKSYLVHNGIIENYQELKEKLLKKGVSFLSKTDTEVIVHLFEEKLKEEKDPFLALKSTVKELRGTYALLIIHKETNKIYFAKEGSPLVLSREEGEVYFSSSDTPLIGLCSKAMYLEDGSLGYISLDEFVLIDKKGKKLNPKEHTLKTSKESAKKEGYDFFMQKEIFEQSTVVVDTLSGRLQDEDIYFEELEGEDLTKLNSISLCACGTSFNASLTASYLFERISKIEAKVEIASEFRYKKPYIDKNSLFIFVSQSGETADTLEALKLAKKAGVKTLAICNVDNSSISREADFCILTRAGIEKGVASTKAFTTQVLVLWMLSIYLAKKRKVLARGELLEFSNLIREVPDALKVKENIHEKIQRLSKRYLHGHGFFFIGRDVFYPLALEGALKLKELSYLHAEGYPAGEMKHGPIALADPELFTFALMPKSLLFDKIKSNVEELSARDSTICAISSSLLEIADDMIIIKEYKHYMLEFFEMTVVLQLLAMEVALRLKKDVDMPRNLAKSVTVE